MRILTFSFGKKIVDATRKKNVLMVSAVELLIGVIKDNKKRPAAIKLFDYMKFNTDIVD